MWSAGVACSRWPRRWDFQDLRTASHGPLRIATSSDAAARPSTCMRSAGRQWHVQLFPMAALCITDVPRVEGIGPLSIFAM